MKCSSEFYDKLSNRRNSLFHDHPLRLYQGIIKYKHAIELSGLNKKKRFLEVGCGTGYHAKLMKNVKDYTAIDCSHESIKLFSKKAPKSKVITADATRLPFKGSIFDLVFCLDVLEHLKKPERAIKEIYRILKPGGKAIFSSPNWISFYGFFRWLIERFVKWQDFSNENPEIDNWFTPGTYEKLIGEKFKIRTTRGSFFIWPFYTGKRYTLPKSIMLVRIYAKFEKVLCNMPLLKKMGYIYMVVGEK